MWLSYCGDSHLSVCVVMTNLTSNINPVDKKKKKDGPIHGLKILLDVCSLKWFEV